MSVSVHHGMLDGAYPPPLAHPDMDGAGQDPLELGVGVPGLEASPTGMIKYESPLPLE